MNNVRMLRIAQPVMTALDVDELRTQLAAARARIAMLEQLADTDPLTGLPNRRPFLRSIDRAIGQYQRHGTPAAVMFADVDGLKALNDSCGHLVGDAALLHISRAMSHEVRTTDCVARIGGDEFGLVLDHLDEPAARAKADALYAAVSDRPVMLGDTVRSIRLSIGVATIQRDDSVEAVIGRADQDMYAVKRAQRSDR